MQKAVEDQLKPLVEQLDKLKNVPVPDFGPQSDWAANLNAAELYRKRRAAGASFDLDYVLGFRVYNSFNCLTVQLLSPVNCRQLMCLNPAGGSLVFHVKHAAFQGCTVSCNTQMDTLCFD